MTSAEPHYDVVIAGGGPAGLAAGLFTARYGLRTLILDRGKSSLRYCAYLENYLGFPGGIKIPAFLDLARAQAADAGCEIVKERAIALERNRSGGARFLVRTSDGASLRAARFVAATPYDVAYLRALHEPRLFDEQGECRAPIDAYGRTAVEGLYLAGALAGVESQVLISAGQAAQMALGLIADVRRSNGLWQAIARHFDWVVWHGCYEGERWAAQVRAHFTASLPTDCEPGRARQTIEQWMRAKRAKQLTKPAVARRSARGRQMLAAHMQRFPADDAAPEGAGARTSAPTEQEQAAQFAAADAST